VAALLPTFAGLHCCICLASAHHESSKTLRRGLPYERKPTTATA
jgi:hypothetical protein